MILSELQVTLQSKSTVMKTESQVYTAGKYKEHVKQHITWVVRKYASNMLIFRTHSMGRQHLEAQTSTDHYLLNPNIYLTAKTVQTRLTCYAGNCLAAS